MGDTTTTDTKSSVFTDVLGDLKSVEEKYIGPDYPYWKYIKMPEEMGMSSEGSFSALGKDIGGIVNYVELLVSGSGDASATGGPLGNKFFLKTGGKCTDITTKQDVDRYIYINNQPEGDIPFISSGMGVSFSEFRGLIPGVMGNLNALNPMEILQSFMAGSKPDCQEVTLQTIDIHNNKSTETHFMTLIDLLNTPACMFGDGRNPVTNVPCNQTNFVGYVVNKIQNKDVNVINTNPNSIEGFSNWTIPAIKDDIFNNAYYLSLGLFGILLLYYIIKKQNRL